MIDRKLKRAIKLQVRLCRKAKRIKLKQLNDNLIMVWVDGRPFGCYAWSVMDFISLCEKITGG